jgi:hypothetical protein
MKVRHYTMTRDVGIGHRSPRRRGFRSICVEFDDETFERIRSRALRERTSVGEQVRILCEWGFESEEQAQA